MASFFSALVFSCCFLLVVSPSIAKLSPRPILRVTKDAKTLQHVIQVSQRTPLVPLKLSIDLGGESMWVNCEQSYESSTYRTPNCGSRGCRLLNSSICYSECLGTPSIFCSNNTCSAYPTSPFGGLGTVGPILGDVFAVQSTDGQKVLQTITVPSLYFICGNNDLSAGLARGVTGVAGLGRSNMSLTAQLSSYFKYGKKFALCLSSSTKSSGVVFFGDGPYTLRPNVDVSASLAYTPLIINPQSASGYRGDASPEYFIEVKTFKINDKPVKGINESLLSFDDINQGGTIISTSSPYTVLETSIYTALVKAFVKEMPPNISRVHNVAPFGACFNSTNIGGTRQGPEVPSIDLVLRSNNVWRIYGANSMVKVSKDILCLGLVEAPPIGQPIISVILGGHQIEDNLLQFDLSKSSLGFSSSLLEKSTSCANFNF